jgi:opacity protein-like surface antigen
MGASMKKLLDAAPLAIFGWVIAILMVGGWTQIANAKEVNEKACWQSDLSYRVYTYKQIYYDVALAGEAGSRTAVTGGDLTSDELYVTSRRSSASENITKFHRVPCPPPSNLQPGGFYVQGGIGGGWSVPGSPGIQSGSGSGMTVDASVGWRQRTLDGLGWAFVGAGATNFQHDERFPAPFDDLTVKPGTVLYQSAGIGPNFPGFAAGQNFAPYVEVGVAEARIKVSAAVGSAIHWSAAPMLGAGIDYRYDGNWLFHAGIRTFFFNDKNYQLGAGGPVFNVSERGSSATAGFIYQFGAPTISAR